MLEIEILSAPGWASLEPTKVMVAEIVEDEGLDCLVTEILIQSVEEAQAARFPGSPTVRVAGVDIDPEIQMKRNYGMGWRLYPDEAGRFKKQVPPPMFRKAIEKIKN